MILPYKGKWPKVHETAFIAPSCDLVGDIEIGSCSSVWFQCVLRGDVHSIKVGSRTNIQDHSMFHVTRKRSPLSIGDEVTVGHRVTLHGCTVKDRCLIGMGAVILDNAVIGEESVIGAGSLITEGKEIPPRSLVMGSPGKVVRTLTDKEVSYLKKSAENYVNDAMEYRSFLQGPKKWGDDGLDLEI